LAVGSRVPWEEEEATPVPVREAEEAAPVPVREAEEEAAAPKPNAARRRATGSSRRGEAALEGWARRMGLEAGVARRGGRARAAPAQRPGTSCAGEEEQALRRSRRVEHRVDGEERRVGGRALRR